MKIWLVDTQKWFLLTYDECKRLLTSGLKPSEWTRENVQKFLMY